MKTRIIYIAVVVFLTSCGSYGHNNFNKRKYLNLKGLKSQTSQLTETETADNSGAEDLYEEPSINEGETLPASENSESTYDYEINPETEDSFEYESADESEGEADAEEFYPEIVNDNECNDTLYMTDGSFQIVDAIGTTNSKVKYYKCSTGINRVFSRNISDVHKLVLSDGRIRNYSDLNMKRSASDNVKKKELNIFALLGFIFCLPVPVLFLPPLGLILGIIGLIQTRKNPEKYSNRWMANFAVIVGVLFMILALVLLILLVL